MEGNVTGFEDIGSEGDGRDRTGAQDSQEMGEKGDMLMGLRLGKNNTLPNEQLQDRMRRKGSDTRTTLG